MITWMYHGRPGARSWISNVIPDLHQPLPPLTYHAQCTMCNYRMLRYAKIVEQFAPIDQFVDDMIAHEFYGNTFVRQDP